MFSSQPTFLPVSNDVSSQFEGQTAPAAPSNKPWKRWDWTADWGMSYKQWLQVWSIMRSIYEKHMRSMEIPHATFTTPKKKTVQHPCICYMSRRGLIFLKSQRCKTYHGIVLQWSAWRLVELTQIISISTYRKMRSAKLTWFTSSGQLHSIICHHRPSAACPLSTSLRA